MSRLIVPLKHLGRPEGIRIYPVSVSKNSMDSHSFGTGLQTSVVFGKWFCHHEALVGSRSSGEIVSWLAWEVYPLAGENTIERGGWMHLTRTQG